MKSSITEESDTSVTEFGEEGGGRDGAGVGHEVHDGVHHGCSGFSYSKCNIAHNLQTHTHKKTHMLRLYKTTQIKFITPSPSRIVLQ